MHQFRRIMSTLAGIGIAAGTIVGCHPVAAYTAPAATGAVPRSVTATPATDAMAPVTHAEPMAADATDVRAPTPTPTGDAATSVQIGTGPFAFSVDLGDWIAKLLAGTWKALGVDEIKMFGDGIAGWLLMNPDLSTSAGQMGNVQRMADALRLAAVAVCIALFVAGVYRVWLGGEAPVSSLGRLLAVLVAIGFYRFLVGWAVAASNAMTDGVLHAGANAATPSFGALLAAIPGTNPVWALAGVISLIFLFVLGVVRLLGYAFLLVAYVLGPLVLPLGLVPETAGYCGVWAKHAVKLLFWPVLWAAEFRLFDALKEGLYLPDSVSHAVLAPFAALGMLIVMFKTPLMLHSGSFEQGARATVRVVRVAAGAAVTAFSGGAAAPVAGAGATVGAGAAPVASAYAHPAAVTTTRLPAIAPHGAISQNGGVQPAPQGPSPRERGMNASARVGEGHP